MAFTLITALFWAITQRVVVISNRRFETTYRFHSKFSSIFPFLDSLTMRIGPIGCPETSVSNYHYSLYNSPEERSSHLLRDGGLKSGMTFIVSLLYNVVTVTGKVCTEYRKVGKQHAYQKFALGIAKKFH
jgi:hypothetical protein